VWGEVALAEQGGPTGGGAGAAGGGLTTASSALFSAGVCALNGDWTSSYRQPGGQQGSQGRRGASGVVEALCFVPSLTTTMSPWLV
jgi:hypothetical protein